MIRKTFFIIYAFMLCIPLVKAQLKRTAVCPVFTVDVLNAVLNDGLNPRSTIGEINKSFPCSSEIQEQASGNKCAGIFFRDKGIYFFTDRDYIEIKENFTGRLSLPLMGASRKSLFKWLGNPKIKDISWDAYQTAYGTLVLYYNKAGKINKLQLSNKNTDALKLCD